MKFYLIVANGKKRGFPIPIEVDLFVVGTAAMCQLRAIHKDIGSQHCAFAVRGSRVFLRDLGSGKVTMVNGEVMEPSMEWPLHKGDKVSIGPQEFMVNFREKQLNQRDLEEWALKQLDGDTGPKRSALDELEAAFNAEMDEDDASSVAGAIISKLSAEKGVIRGRLRISQEGMITLVRINDAFLVDDAELIHLRRELHENLSKPSLRVLLDFKSVVRMSTAAAETFTEMIDWLRGFGSTLAMCRLSPELRNMMQGMQAMYSFRIFSDKEAARATKW